jgi:N-methylhydantoinase B/oxoprolinase/acetone carboxylase alpha subunit
MDHPAVKYITDNSDIARDNDRDARFEYVDQAFVSKRYGKERYLDTLNKALEAQQMSFEPLVQGMKYMCDKVGINTVIRYNRDIISYAEIFGGEYSVTYDQEIEWK